LNKWNSELHDCLKYMNIISYIESNGFRIRGRYIEKRSQSTRSYKVVGQLNDNNFFFFSDNVYPFKQGINSFKNTSIIDDGNYKEHIAKVKENNRNDFDVNFENYIETTKASSIFGTFLNNSTREFINKNAQNYFDIRGVRKGYMEDAVLFPFFDYENNFVTAQIIKYQPNGKRVKTAFGTNWFHAYNTIKEDLGLKKADKYSVPIKCFFGENYLNGSRNPVAIVEAPKTAVILKEFYPNIDWIATGGEQQIFNKDLSVLKGKDVVIFGDAHSSKWSDFAKENKFIYCDILDIEDVEKGSDIADFILDAESVVFDELHNFIFSLNDGSFDFETNEDDLEFDFQITGEERYKNFNIVHKIDNADKNNIIFNGKNFDIYESNYWVLNANVDFHKQQRTEDGKPVGFNEKELIWHLQKCYRVLKSLNLIHAELGSNQENQFPIKAIYKQTLKALLKHSNFSFNIYYVMKRLIPLWDSFNRDLSSFKKTRNWKYKGGENISRDTFERELNNDRFRCKLNMRLLAFKDVLEEDRFIHLETDLCLSTSQRGYPQIKKLVKDWNNEVIGCSTLSTYFDSINFSSDFERIVKNLPLYIKELIWSDTKFTIDGISRAELSVLMGYSVNKVNDILNFKQNRDTRTIIEKEVNVLLGQINDIEPVRLTTENKTRITDFRYIKQLSKSEWCEKYNMVWSNENFQFYKDYPNKVFQTREQLIIEAEAVTDENLLKVYVDEITYLTDLKSKKIEKEETGHKYNLSRKKLDEIIARSKTLKVVEETPLNMDLANF
jgi:hypothetical protein